MIPNASLELIENISSLSVRAKSRTHSIMRTYYVYILKCADKTYYTGFTNNLERRFSEHQDGENINAYTYKRRPVDLVFYEEFSDPNYAIAFEKKVKDWSRKKKEALIESNWEKLKVYSRCLNKTSHKYYKG